MPSEHYLKLCQGKKKASRAKKKASEAEELKNWREVAQWEGVEDTVYLLAMIMLGFVKEDKEIGEWKRWSFAQKERFPKEEDEEFREKRLFGGGGTEEGETGEEKEGEEEEMEGGGPVGGDAEVPKAPPPKKIQVGLAGLFRGLKEPVMQAVPLGGKRKRTRKRPGEGEGS